MQIINLKSRRAIPLHGYDVHVTNLENDGGLIALYQNRYIVWQDHQPTFDCARDRARTLADRHRCAMIEHHPYANRNEA